MIVWKDGPFRKRAVQKRSFDPDAAPLRRVGWRLALLTAGLITVLLLALGSAVYITTQNFLMSSLQQTIVQRTQGIEARFSGQGGGPFSVRGRGVPSFVGDVAFVITDQQLSVLSPTGPFMPTAPPDPAAARQALHGKLSSPWSTQQVDSAGPYLIYTLPLPLDFVQPDTGVAEPVVLQAYASEQQYLNGLNLLLDVLLGVSIAGLLAATAISALLARRALRPIQSALQRQRDFVADAAHELRTPLTIMRTATELGLAAGTLPEQQGAMEQTLVQNAHLTRLVDALSLLARADSGVVTLERQPVDLSRLTLETAEGVEMLAEEHGVCLHVEASRETRVLGDAGRLRQLLLILLDNALKYTAKGDSIAVSVEGQGGRARLQVRDSGPGIDPRDLPHVFDRFYRADRARTGEGTGLGLAIGRWIAEAHGGTITATNAPDHGALFTVTLPLAR